MIGSGSWSASARAVATMVAVAPTLERQIPAVAVRYVPSALTSVRYFSLT